MQELIQIWFQELFSNFYEIFDPFFLAISAFGHESLFLVICLIIYWVFDKKIAKITGVACLAGTAISNIIKDVAMIERPIFDENIRFVEYEGLLVNTKEMANSYSFPSVHSLVGSSFYLGLAIKYKNKWLKVALIIFSILIPLSRLYLGVHWPIDLIVGYAMGIVFFLLFDFLYEKLTKIEILYYIIMAVSIIFVFISNNEDAIKSFGALFGSALAILLEERTLKFNTKDTKWWEKIIICVVGLAIAIGIKVGLKSLFGLIGDSLILDYIRYVIITFVALYAYPLLFTTVRKKIKNDKESKLEGEKNE